MKISPPDRQPEAFRKALLDWYARNARPLPWRQTRDPYAIWVSEVMLQQTRVDTVLDYYQRFLHRFPDVHSLASASLEEVLKQWEGLGYYARARHLHRAAREVVSRFGGKIPRDPAQFRSLPGVGVYTCAAVMSLAYKTPLPVVDGNVRRVLARLFALSTPPGEPATEARLSELAEQLLDPQQPHLYNQAMMELGALICTPRQPHCAHCPVQGFCLAFAQKKQNELPVRRPRRQVPTLHIAVGVVQKEGRLLITRRREKGLLGGLWEFPGGKVEAGETAEQACLRELQEEVNLQVQLTRKLGRVRHAYTHFKIVMDVFLCQYVAGEVVLNSAQAYRWVRPDELKQFPFPRANQHIFPWLAEL